MTSPKLGAIVGVLLVGPRELPLEDDGVAKGDKQRIKSYRGDQSVSRFKVASDPILTSL
jgi:hypothetical protein